MTLLHATCVEWAGTGILLCGPSGSGKSDLALRLMDAGAKLAADDETIVEKDGNKLKARCPDKIKGLLEVRGIGIVRTDFIAETAVGVKLNLRPRNETERMPELKTEVIDGIEIPAFDIDAFAASAVAKVKMIVRTKGKTVE